MKFCPLSLVPANLIFKNQNTANSQNFPTQLSNNSTSTLNFVDAENILMEFGTITYKIT